MNRFFVRTAGPADLEAIGALLRETWHATYDAIYGPERVQEITAAWHGAETLRPRLARPGSEFVVADDGAEIAGMAYAALPSAGDRDCVTLHQLYVRPDMQRQGIGSDLFAEIESCFFDARRIRVEVEAANEGALAFFRRVGFRETIEPAALEAGGDEVPLVVLEKHLADI